MADTYRLMPGPIFVPIRLALARRYRRIEDAVADMGTGVVVRDGEIVAFHEKHLPMMERLEAGA